MTNNATYPQGIKFKYDDDTYEIIDESIDHSQFSSQNQFDNPSEKYIQKIENYLDSRKSKRRLNALRFLNELNKTKKRVIVEKIISSNSDKIANRENLINKLQ